MCLKVDSLGLSECVGCELCVSVCPKQCISMASNEEGFYYPKIDNSRCVHCGICLKKCPSLSKSLSFTYPKLVYAGFSNDEMIDFSASGGVFISAARYIINEKQGSVFGVVLEDTSFVCKFVEATTIEELVPMQNSKYVQAKVGNIYKVVKERLVDGHYVLFSGSPCHIAALKTYLVKDYDRLFTLDIICHGVPSPLFWSKYISQLGNNVKNIRFRCRNNRKIGKPTHALTLEKYKGKVKMIWGAEDVFLGTYLKRLNLRLSCYSCKYAQGSRLGDITMGDFDSIFQLPNFYKNQSKSNIIINTENGIALWNAIKCSFTYQRIDYNVESKINHCLTAPSFKPACRSEFYNDMNNMEWNAFSRKYKTPKDFIIKRILRRIKRVFIRTL